MQRQNVEDPPKAEQIKIQKGEGKLCILICNFDI